MIVCATEFRPPAFDVSMLINATNAAIVYRYRATTDHTVRDIGFLQYKSTSINPPASGVTSRAEEKRDEEQSDESQSADENSVEAQQRASKCQQFQRDAKHRRIKRQGE